MSVTWTPSDLAYLFSAWRIPIRIFVVKITGREFEKRRAVIQLVMLSLCPFSSFMLVECNRFGHIRPAILAPRAFPTIHYT